MMKALPFTHHPDRVTPKASDNCQQLIAILNARENLSYFSVCYYGFSKGEKSLNNTVVYMK